MPTSSVLIVDDDVTNRRVLESWLRREGYQTRSAVDGYQALLLVEQELPDLILLDVMMPGLDGFEVCRQLRERPVTRAVPIVMVTTLADRESRVRGLQAGADDFLNKPVDATEMLARCRSLLRLRHYQGLTEQRELLEAAAADLADGVLVAESDWRVVAANRRARHLLDIREDELVGLSLPAHLERFEVRPPLAEAAPPLGRPEIGRPVRPGEPPLVLDAQVTSAPDLDGAPAYFALVVRDVTAERGLQTYRHDFLALTAHKIRTPLTILTGLLELVDADRDSAHAAALVQQLLPDLQAKLNHLTTSLDDLLMLDELAARQARPERLETALAPALELARAAVSARHPGRDFAVRVRGPERAVPMDQADLGIVLRELLENAAKFGDGGRVELDFELAGDEREVLLLAADNAAGIPHEHFETVFEACVQLDLYFTGSIPGLGLGLPLVRRLAAAYGGGFDIVDSAPGRGTTWRLRVPVPAAPA
ncbi:MAG: response regulator [Armatimonadetes bacterium]|nr:response regulator [Armatimonadota bacterium]